MVMPSKLWRFEWSERGTIIVSFLVKMKEVYSDISVPKSGSRIYMILLLKTSSEPSYYYTEISSSLNLAVEFT